MKKVFQNWACICCVFALLLTGIPLSAAAAAQTTFHLRIEGSSQTVLNEDVPLTAGETLENALKTVLDAQKISYTFSPSQYGDYIDSIGSDTGASNYSTYWSIYQNGTYASEGISSLTPAAGDDIVLAFAATDTLYPTVSVSPAAPAAGQPLTFHVTGSDGATSSNVAGAIVTFNGQNQTTDANGDAPFTAPAAGSYTYSVRDDRSGQPPLLVRIDDAPLTVSADTLSSSGSSSSSLSGSSAASSSAISAPAAPSALDTSVAGAVKGAAAALGNDDSDWTAFALARAGYAIPGGYLPDAAAVIAQGDLDAITLAKYVLVLRAAGADPTNFNGVNLVDQLYEQTNVGHTGLNGYIFALLALDSADYTPPSNAVISKPSLLSAVLAAQNTDGGFGLSAGYSDVDITAMVLAALAPHLSETGVQAAVTRGLAYLAAQQRSDGGFIARGSTTESAESAAQVIIALSSLGVNPSSDAQFLQNGNSPLSNLLSFALPSGAFAHVSGGNADTIATQQALEGLAAYQRLEHGGRKLFDLRDTTASVQRVTPTPSAEPGVNNPYTGGDAPTGALAAVSLAAVAVLLLSRRRRT